jgi:hypothetical protein
MVDVILFKDCFVRQDISEISRIFSEQNNDYRRVFLSIHIDDPCFEVEMDISVRSLLNGLSARRKKKGFVYLRIGVEGGSRGNYPFFEVYKRL